VPSTLQQDSGWGAQQILILLVVLLTLGLVFVPAFAWRRMSQRPAPTAGEHALVPEAQRERVTV
jgi:hypothetical protein